MIKEFESIEKLSQHSQRKICDNLFFSNGYKDLVESEKRSFFILSDNDYAIPIALFRKICFVQASFLFQPICLSEENRVDKVKIFLDKCVEYLSKKKHVQYISPNPAYTDFVTYPSKSIRIPFGNYVCDLRKSEEELFADMHSKHRNSVRKAQKDGVEIKCGICATLLSDYVFLDEQTWRRSGKGTKGIDFYRSKIEKIPNNCMIFIAYKDEKPQSAAFIYYDGSCGYYMFGANADRPHVGSGNLLQWEIMRYLKEKGVKSYSFVGCRIDEDENSKYHDIQRFKSRFGGELRRGYMFKTVCKPIMNKLFILALKIKRKSIAQDVITQEIHKWKSIN